MKKWVLYIVGIVCGTAMFSCTAEEELDSAPSDKNEKVTVSFTLNGPLSRASQTETDENYTWERYIDETDVRAFIFIGNTYREEVKIWFFEDNDGAQTRTMRGRISKAYEGKELKMVVFTNMKNRGVKEPTLIPGTTTKEGLYKQLIFPYGDKAWTFSENEKKYIPMWGVSEDFKITDENGINNAGDITMYRAVAKIDITVKDGAGLDNFVINKVELCNVPNQGYCASLKTPSPDDNQFESVSLPEEINTIKEALTVYEYNGTDKTTSIENKIYVPEMGLVGLLYKPFGFSIKIYATVTEEAQVYDIYMREEQGNSQTAFDVIRNHKYIININSFTPQNAVKVNYDVVTWGESSVYIPGFE